MKKFKLEPPTWKLVSVTREPPGKGYIIIIKQVGTSGRIKLTVTKIEGIE